jgi:excisionase family DNA binding protein
MLTVEEVADYLRLKQRKIYYLIAQKRIPCVRVSGKWLFPKERIDQWLHSNCKADKAASPTSAAIAAPAPPVLSGSHDPLLEWALQELGFPLAVRTTGSADGLRRFAAGEASACGLHLLEAGTDEYNLAAVQGTLSGQDIVLIEWAWREQGLIVAAGNPLSIRALADLKTQAARVIERQPGSGGHTLFQHLLTRQGIAPEELKRLPQEARSETDVGLAILGGKADAGLALAAVAGLLHLDFFPLARERFDLLLRRRDYFEPPFQTLLAFTRTPAFQEKAREMGGYDIAQLGQVRYNAPLT